MASLVFKPGNTALITGGASGIGLALAKKCHGCGMRVAIVDVSRENLELARVSIGPEKSSLFPKWRRCSNCIIGHISLLALNAGIGPRGTWSDPYLFQTVISTNLFGITNGISTFLTPIQSTATPSSPTAIVITGSKQGITNPPGNPAYNASKAAVKTVAEQLSYDLRHSHDITVHLLVPGWTHTGLTSGGKLKPGGGGTEGKPAGAWTPEQVVEYLVAKMKENQFYVVCPDNEVSEEMDRRRMLWSGGDVVEGRPPLSRWREDWKDKAEEGMRNMRV